MSTDQPLRHEEEQYQAIIRDLAVGMVSRVRNDAPGDYRRFLDQLTPEVLREVTVFLAELVPDNKTISQLTRWKNQNARRAGKPMNLRPMVIVAPCGTPAALSAHRDNDDPFCLTCERAEWQRQALANPELQVAA